MNIKTAVTWALIASFFAAGNIFLFGLAGSSYFRPAYMLFALALAGVLVSAAGGKLKKVDIMPVAVLLVLAAGALTFFAGALKVYLVSGTAEQETLMAEMADIAAMNDYYAGYIDYLGGEIMKYDNSSLSMAGKISELRAAIAAAEAVPVQEEVAPVAPVREERRYEHDEDDDDEWEDEDDD